MTEVSSRERARFTLSREPQSSPSSDAPATRGWWHRRSPLAARCSHVTLTLMLARLRVLRCSPRIFDTARSMDLYRKTPTL